MRWLVLTASVMCLAGCDDGGADDAGAPLVDAGAGDDAGAPDAGAPMELTLGTTAFDDGGPVPQRYQCGPPLIAASPGMNVSPALSWTAGPAGTMSYAVIVRDQSAGGLVHWAIYDIPLSTTSIAEDVPDGFMPAFPAGAKQAEIQGSGYFGYFGPCSGGRGNTYVWTVHAIDAATFPGVDRSSTEDQVAAMVESASLASASFTGIW